MVTQYQQGLATLDVATLEPKLASSSHVDPYRLRASEIFGVAPDKVTATQRNYAKVTLYYEIYGGKT